LSKPKLIVLAGPNGAGKSTFAENVDLNFIKELGITSFDYDLEFKKLYEQYSSIMNAQIEQNLAIRTKEIFEEQADLSLQNKKHFSFQTNFDKEYTDKWRLKFTEAGFETELYFLYVDSIEQCIKRVAKRVDEGGHNVPEDEIGRRYIQGLINFDNSFLKYNKVVLIDTSLDVNCLMLVINNFQISHINERFVDVVFKNKLVNMINWLKNLH
jgi:predicted ABC-type ATPase